MLLSARDALHVAVMQRVGVILSVLVLTFGLVVRAIADGDFTM